jgi:hypothetical protein
MPLESAIELNDATISKETQMHARKMNSNRIETE